MLINVVTCLIILFKITAPLVQPALTGYVDKPPVEAALYFMETSIWKSVVGYEGLYEVSSGGQVRTIQRIESTINKNGKIQTFPIKAKIKTQRLGKIGYLTIALVRANVTKNTTVHRIIAEAFIDKPEGCNVVNHKNGIKTDNRIENLEWTTYSANNVHALVNKLRRPAKQVSKEFKDSVLALKGTGKTNLEIANILNSTEYIVQGITSKRSQNYVQ